MDERLPEKKKMFDVVMETLKNGEQPISKIGKALEDEGIHMHRIRLSGYLHGLVDAGILSERRIKPISLFSIQKRETETIYDIVGKVCRSMKNYDEGDSALAILYTLLGRPVFENEIARCNVKNPKKFRTVTSNRRIDLIRKLTEIGIRIPEGNMLIAPEDINPDRTLKFLAETVSQIYDIKKYTVQDNGNTQKTLD